MASRRRDRAKSALDTEPKTDRAIKLPAGVEERFDGNPVPSHEWKSKKKQGEPADPKAKEAHNPGKINKHKLAGQNEASAPSRLRGNYDISSIAVLVQHSFTHLPTGFREAWSSTTPTHASFCSTQQSCRFSHDSVCRVHCALFGHPRPSYKPRSSTHLPTCFREA